MLKTNSKKATENIRAYIMENFSAESYTETQPETWPEIARFILKTFRSEKYNCINDYRYYHMNEYSAFFDWCAGLPTLLDTCYFYNRSAIKDLSRILEETETESSKYDESDAEKLLTTLIYRALIKEDK